MPLSFEVTGAQKDQLVVSLAAILLSDSGVDITAENIDSIVNATGNKIPSYYSALYATFIEKAGGVDKFFSGPSAGGGGGAAAPAAAGGGAAAPAAAKAPEKPKEEEVDALEGGMSMFGGGGGGGGDY
eukprot:gene12382-16609_t